ncbi:YgaP family membrane protein [Marinithermus hydrothermalis]|uniref:Inner membrane protein YgaP-like transmembrane domain-containing protein n=1 Tax=Marinithermus hydrothermalis (strain DSM 14884 / JCM 11576 / T1) TaxID=869210 RepID=F2NMP4_MARHT|nr:DUF2892 domain-containing protein [Marinithermus hydrothermalis]AEB12428.1 hypothetical protein Marky_1693 [Marinithermus hydrothermalis DSM 14884]
MECNVGTTDRFVRLVLGVVLLLAALTGQVSGPAGTVLGVIGAVFVLTGTLRFCPLYRLLGVRTCPPPEAR